MINIDVLAIFAHPDDMELGVGGTLLKMKSLGYKTGALDVTRGEMGTRGTADGRAGEAKNAADILKLDVRENLGLPDGHVFADDESRTKLVRKLRQLKAENHSDASGRRPASRPQSHRPVSPRIGAAGFDEKLRRCKRAGKN